MSLNTQNAPKNRLLRALPEAELERFCGCLHPVSLSLKQVIGEIGTPLEQVYFIEEGVASVLTGMADGATIEVGMIGSEGVAGIAALLGDEVHAQQTIIQVHGNALRMKAADFRCLFDQSAEVRTVMLRYFSALLSLGAQTAACNRLHSVEQRCARWLLMAHDRLGSDVMPMTHEFLASMLGVRRAGVTETAGELQRLALIRYHRGEITIVDRAGLEAAACECYRVDHERLMRTN